MEKQAESELDALILEVIMDVRGCLTILDHVCVHLENNPSFNNLSTVDFNFNCTTQARDLNYIKQLIHV